MASTPREPMSPEPESIFDNHQNWNITGDLTDQKKVNKKVVTSLFEEANSLTEAFFDEAMKSASPGEATRELDREAIDYKDAFVVKFREAFKQI
ncbi:hypothetical protein O181_058304 [Austropuccinia psidii MF-1]|uniref:Uncharacterized protein n=1 Tax=Austropuccinia psidii MF-1 TaxID=1389203 RepID=A0A9Q3HXI4_9BASI|nr:hypothetical protein [Austropuccinia psidii MF-1]